MAHAGGRPPKYKAASEIQKLIDKYFVECDEKQYPYTITGLALALDMTRQQLISYAEKDEFMDTIKKAKLKVEEYIESGSLSGRLNPTASIFNLKNNFGWKDRTEMKIGNADDKPFKQDISVLSVEDLKAMKQILSKTENK